MFYNLRRKLIRGEAFLKRLRTEARRFEGIQYQGCCTVCGSMNLMQKDILWDRLVDVWSLSKMEVSYINRQQGYRCVDCGSRLRSMAMAHWFVSYVGRKGTLENAISSGSADSLAILEVNEAGSLTPWFKRLKGHTLGCYPDLDMLDMRYDSDFFDIVVHSDTLEHVSDPVRALSECRRVLRPGGVCAFTVPAVMDRLSHSTDGFRKTFHGHSGLKSDDFRVRSEFGGDVWKFIAAAGFRECSVHIFEYPAGLVYLGKK